MGQPIPTYIINLRSRPERKIAVLQEFEGKPEYDITLVEAIPHEIGLHGLWATMKHILTSLAPNDTPYILICQDDHQFTEHYSFETLEQSILEAQHLDADIILGGTSWFHTAFSSSKHLFWTEKFSGLQFAIIFRRFFVPLAFCELDNFDAGDFRISALTERKWVIYPFISTQKEYGYSDVTPKYNHSKAQDVMFSVSDQCRKTLLSVESYFRDPPSQPTNNIDDLTSIILPTFVIRNERKEITDLAVNDYFEKHPGFDLVSVIEVDDSSTGQGMWYAISQAINAAIETDDDAIVICKAGFTFTEVYSRQYFIESIVKAHWAGADLLLGDVVEGFMHILPVTESLFWINGFSHWNMMVIYRNLFLPILNHEYQSNVTIDQTISSIAVNKLVLYPFISTGATPTAMHDTIKQSLLRFEKVSRNHTSYHNAIA
jgi:GR25 family glycosyltransferase involved in LPS biosynthesis